MEQQPHPLPAAPASTVAPTYGTTLPPAQPQHYAPQQQYYPVAQQQYHPGAQQQYHPATPYSATQEDSRGGGGRCCVIVAIVGVLLVVGVAVVVVLTCAPGSSKDGGPSYDPDHPTPRTGDTFPRPPGQGASCAASGVVSGQGFFFPVAWETRPTRSGPRFSWGTNCTGRTQISLRSLKVRRSHIV